VAEQGSSHPLVTKKKKHISFYTDIHIKMNIRNVTLLSNEKRPEGSDWGKH